MAYSRENLLIKVIEIKDIMLEHQRRGVSQKWVFDNIIRDRYFISMSTFNNYLAMPARRELRELRELRERRERQRASEPGLFDEY